jgi:hypothetical protein
MRHLCEHANIHTDRRSFMLGSAGVLVAGLAASLARPGMVVANGFPKHKAPLPAPKPIPGGVAGPPPVFIHQFLPGPVGITLPFSGLPLEGLDAEPSQITDFTGFTALAYFAGTATGSDGTQYNVESDIRVMKGEYIGEDGAPHEGTFGEF